MDPGNINSIIGALLIGAALSLGLYGCLMVQFYIYYTTPVTSSVVSQDPTWLICIVGILCVLESGFTLLVTHSTWVFVVDSYAADVRALMHTPGPWTFAICPAFTGLIASIVQVFLARRIWNLSKRLWQGRIVTIVIILLAFTEGVLCLTVTTKFLQGYQDPQQFLEGYRANLVYLILGLICDATITLTMTMLLWRAKTAATSALSSRVNEIILKGVETGAVITVAASVSLFFFLYQPLTSLGVTLMFSISRLYTMTLLASLNGRRHLPTNETEQDITLTITTRSTQSR
ncbi:hypothetical protein AX16_003512 [Volvariella volvacea WC 439]|nr:hypothetical protein AX16_003512 [Volvariella volvacea WC 439]